MIVNDTITPELERIKAEFEKLKEMKLHIGIQGGNGFGAGRRGPRRSTCRHSDDR